MMSFMPTLMQTLRMARLLTILLVPVLAACGQRQSQPQASPPPPQVTIAKPVSKMVADQDEYVGPGRSRHVNVWNPTCSEERPLSGRAEMSWAEHYVAETSTAAFFRVAWGRSASNCVHPPSAATQTHSLCGKFALERGAAGRGAKLAFNELGAISFTMRGRGDRTAT